jgi:Membrane proteins related to metalloendopeptidases
MNNIKVIIIIVGCVFLAPLISLAGNNNGKNKDIKPVSAQLMDEKVSELMADRIEIKKNLFANELISIDDLIMEHMIAREELMFPAEEIYGAESWDSRRVNPFANTRAEFPDSVEIDCSRFVLPIDIDVRVTSKYGPRGRRMHNGIDLKVYTGDTIRSAFDGKIRLKAYERRGYGNYLVIRHPNGLETVYGHMSAVFVKENDIVRAGEAIGLGGNTGRSTGSHLHFETRFLGQPINPAELIDFENGVPHENVYVFRNIIMNGKKTNRFTASNTEPIYHRVRSGETLGAIARRYGTSINALCQMNGLRTTSVLRIGQSLHVGTVVVKDANKQQPVVKQQLEVIAKATTVTAELVASATEASVTETQAVEVEPAFHRVRSGETLGAIARRYRTSVNELCRLNGLRVTSVLHIGQSLQVSAKAASSELASAIESEESEPVFHSIISGDTLGKIAQQYGTSISELCRLNGISRTTVLRLGRTIRCS